LYGQSLHRAPGSSDPGPPSRMNCGPLIWCPAVDRLAEPKPLATCQRPSVLATILTIARTAVSRNARPTPATRESGATKNSVNSTNPSRSVERAYPTGDLLGLRRSPRCVRRAEVDDETPVKPAIARRDRGQAGRWAGSQSGRIRSHSERRNTTKQALESAALACRTTAAQAIAARIYRATFTSAPSGRGSTHITVQHANATRNERASPPVLRSPRSGTRSDSLGWPCAHTRSVGSTKARPSAPRTIGVHRGHLRRHDVRYRFARTGSVATAPHIRRRRPRLSFRAAVAVSCCRSLSPAARSSGKPRGPAIRDTRTCISRTDRPGPSPRGSNDTCSRPRPAHRSSWAGGLPRHLRRCADPPAGRARARR
jgi:hypothetical protein